MVKKIKTNLVSSKILRNSLKNILKNPLVITVVVVLVYVFFNKLRKNRNIKNNYEKNYRQMNTAFKLLENYQGENRCTSDEIKELEDAITNLEAPIVSGLSSATKEIKSNRDTLLGAILQALVNMLSPGQYTSNLNAIQNCDEENKLKLIQNMIQRVEALNFESDKKTEILEKLNNEYLKIEASRLSSQQKSQQLVEPPKYLILESLRP